MAVAVVRRKEVRSFPKDLFPCYCRCYYHFSYLLLPATATATFNASYFRQPPSEILLTSPIVGYCKLESLSLYEDKITAALRLVLLIDNFDSFTYNLVDYVEQCGERCEVIRNTASLTGLDVNAFSSIILSPGPQTPRQAGGLMGIIDQYIRQKPMLGICLGHQAIGEYFGAQLVRAKRPMHGKLSTIQCQEDPLFDTIPAAIEVVRYHSLILTHMPASLEPIAQTNDGEIMALRHRELAVRGVQFHPEAALTAQGLEIIRNWLIFARGRR